MVLLIGMKAGPDNYLDSVQTINYDSLGQVIDTTYNIVTVPIITHIKILLDMLMQQEL